MKIIQVLLDPRIGGAERLAETLQTVWRAEGDQVATVYLDPAPADSTSPLSRIVRLRRLLRGGRPDLVISHSAIPNAYARLCAPLRTPLISVLHSASDDFDALRYRMVERILLHRGRVVAVSEQQAETYHRHFPSVMPTVVPNGIADGLPRRPSTPRPPTTVISVARVAPQKQPGLWEEIAQIAASELPALKFVWFGPEGADAELRELVRLHRALKAPGTFAGSTDRVGEELEKADIFLHTSSREAHSIGVLEAAAVGLPVVCGADTESALPEGLAAGSFTDAAGAVACLKRLTHDWESSVAAASMWADVVRDRYSAKRCAAAYKSLGR